MLKLPTYKSWAASLLAASAVLTTLPNVKAVPGFSTDFQTFIDGNEVAGQGGWSTNDPTDVSYGGTNLVIDEAGSVSAELGGIYTSGSYYPGNSFVTLTHSVGDLGDGSPSVSGFGFNTVFSIRNSTTSTTAKDTFGFTFTSNPGGVEYATILFTPRNQNVWDGIDPTSDDAKLDISVRYGSFTRTENLQSAVYGNTLNLEILVNSLGVLSGTLNNVTILDGFDPNTNTTTPIVLGPGSSDIDDFGIVWELETPSVPASGAEQEFAGDNSIVVESISIVPEPSTVGLCVIAGLGGLGIVIRRRKTA